MTKQQTLCRAAALGLMFICVLRFPQRLAAQIEPLVDKQTGEARLRINEPFLGLELDQPANPEDLGLEFNVPLSLALTEREQARLPDAGPAQTHWQSVLEDHRNFYDWHSLRMLAGGFVSAAVIANTQLDQEIQNHFQSSVRGATSDDWFEFLHANKELGNGFYLLPISAGAWVIGGSYDHPAMATTSEWGQRSIRSFLVGAPPLILAQSLTGGSRPNELGDSSSHWNPWSDNNGVSGHAFMSALPFINAAKMTDNRLLKTSLYTGSLLGPLSRVNDNAHYPSQVALGWWMAFVAASAVDRTEAGDGRLKFYPYTANSGYGAALEFRY